MGGAYGLTNDGQWSVRRNGARLRNATTFPRFRFFVIFPSKLSRFYRLRRFVVIIHRDLRKIIQFENVRINRHKKLLIYYTFLYIKNLVYEYLA